MTQRRKHSLYRLGEQGIIFVLETSDIHHCLKELLCALSIISQDSKSE
jgi:hypothetical protein